MSRDLPVAVSLLLVGAAFFLAYCYFFVFATPGEEEQSRLALIGVLLSLLALNKDSCVWTVVNGGCLGWNFMRLTAQLWGG